MIHLRIVDLSSGAKAFVSVSAQGRCQKAFLVELFFVNSRSVRLAREPPQNPINFPIKLICTRMSCIEDLARISRAHYSAILAFPDSAACRELPFR